MERAPSDAAFKVCRLRNSGEAYRQFGHTGFVTVAHEMVVDLMRHKLVGAAIALMGAAGLVGLLITFWPR